MNALLPTSPFETWEKEVQRSKDTRSKAHCGLLEGQGLRLIEHTDHQVPCYILGVQDKRDMPHFSQARPYRASTMFGLDRTNHAS